jgi:hypothetical protein
MTQALAEGNKIIEIRVLSETTNEVNLEVRYNYSGNFGHNVFMSTVMAENGQPSQYYAYRPGRIQIGHHKTRVVLGTSQSAPEWFATDQLLVQMYVGGGEPFQKRLFRYSKTWTRPGAVLPGVLPHLSVLQPVKILTPEEPSERGVPKRRILADGVVEVRYPDGTIKRIFEGGMDVISPDGKVTPYRYASAQPPTPPSIPPDSQHVAWLEAEARGLLNIIGLLVGNDETSINNYLQKEGSDTTYYQKLSSRRRAIEFLLMP